MEYDSPMSCPNPECNSQWGIIDGNTLICGRCGYRHTVPLKPTYEDLERKILELEEKLWKTQPMK